MTLPKILQDNLSIPVIGAPLFLVSGPELVIAQCKAGIVGSFPALNARPQHVLEEWLIRIKEELAQAKVDNPSLPIAPFAVNQICHGSNDRLMGDMELCVKHEAPIIITSLRPPEEIVTAAHSYGGLVYHDVISVRHAKKAAEQGVDGLILVCAGAGGHAGTLSPFALVREVREFFDGTIILSGSISSGSAIASGLALGADLAYLGTRFIATEEANADQGYKQMLIESAADEKAAQILQDAKLQIESEKNKAMNDIRDMVVDLSIDIASKILDKEVDVNENQQMIDDTLKKIGQA